MAQNYLELGSNNYTSQKNRIEYIDSMRGFTMLLVVYAHIFLFSTPLKDLVTFNTLFVQFRMPLFFFVSGFVFYKKERIWSFDSINKFLKNKARVQLLSTMIFFLLFCLVSNYSIIDCMFSSPKAGYWFTLALFNFFLVQVTIEYICKKINSKYRFIVSSLILLNISAIGYLLYLYNPVNSFYLLLGIENFKFFFFFVFGTIVRRKFGVFCKCLDNNLFITFVITGFLCLFLIQQKLDCYRYTPWMLMLGTLGIIITFSFFRKNESYFTKQTIVGKSLQYIGTRTLDIYLLHYFFLPRNLNFMSNFFMDYNNPIIEFTFSLLIAIIVVGICLVVSSIIRLSPILGFVLFGVKTKQ